jgi:hypothetical protein
VMLILLDTCVNSSVKMSVAESQHAHETLTVARLMPTRTECDMRPVFRVPVVRGTLHRNNRGAIEKEDT